LGGSATSCILGLHLRRKGHKVTLFEKNKNIGGAWAIDRHGAKYSNIIAGLKEIEKKNFRKIFNFLKNFHVRFDNNSYKGLFTKKVLHIRASDLSKLISLSKQKLKIKYNYRINSIKENKNYVILNNTFKFDYVFFPKNVCVKKIQLLNKNKLRLVKYKYKKDIKSIHLRFFTKCDSLKKLAFSTKGVGPMDRLQISSYRNNSLRVNGRIKLEWKNKPNVKILDEIKSKLKINKVISPKFFNFSSKYQSNKQILELREKIKWSKRLIYINTNSMTEFVLENFILKKPRF